MDITFWNILGCFKYIWLNLHLIYSIIFKNLTNNEKLECMECIRDKIILVTKFGKSFIYTSKLRLWMEFLGDFFYGVWYWYTWIKSRTNYRFKVFGWNFIQKMCVFFILNNQCVIISVFYEKNQEFP
jgi:hypothetical protein